MCVVLRALTCGTTLRIALVASSDTNVLVKLTLFSRRKTLGIDVFRTKAVRHFITLVSKTNIPEGALLVFGATLIGKWVAFADADTHVFDP